VDIIGIAIFSYALLKLSIKCLKRCYGYEIHTGSYEMEEKEKNSDDFNSYSESYDVSDEMSER
jgi:hypothetical protein